MDGSSSHRKTPRPSERFSSGDVPPHRGHPSLEGPSDDILQRANEFREAAQTNLEPSHNFQGYSAPPRIWDSSSQTSNRLPGPAREGVVDHLRTTPAPSSTDAPTTPARPPQFEQGSSSSSSKQSWRHLDKLKGSLAKKGEWDNKFAQKIRKAGGLTKNEVKELRGYLKDQYLGESLAPENSKFNNEYKQYYDRIGNLEESHLAATKSKAHIQTSSETRRETENYFGKQGINKGLHSWQLPPSAK
jgi:hypothetical protein